MQVLWDLIGTPHETCDSSIYDTLEPVSAVDVFVSHSWHCPAWTKALAVCHHLNVDRAIIISSLATISSVLILVLHAGSFSGVAQHSQGLLFSCLICLPVVSFLIPYFFGHVAIVRKSFWLDRVCVDQEKKDLKAQILQALPAFVAQSTQMLVLWDSTYFERLWCNYELAVHAKTFVSEDATQLVPVWVPLWTLCWFCVASLTSFLAFGEQSPQLDDESRTSLFVSMFESNYVPPYVYLFASLPFSWFCISKLHSHKTMLDQMSQFDLRNAKCAVESDREVIEEQVCQLFEECLHPSFCTSESLNFDEESDARIALVSHDHKRQISILSNPEVVDYFNAYVRGPLKDIVLRSVGREDYISLKLCFVVSFPLLLLGLVFVLGCDGRAECETSAVYSGYPSISQYMLANAAINLLIQPLVNVLGLPLMLRANHLVTHFVGGHSVQILVGSVVSGLVLKVMDNLLFAQRGMIVVVVTRFSPMWLVGLIASVMLQLGLLWLLFIRCSPRNLRCAQ